MKKITILNILFFLLIFQNYAQKIQLSEQFYQITNYGSTTRLAIFTEQFSSETFFDNNKIIDAFSLKKDDNFRIKSEHTDRYEYKHTKYQQYYKNYIVEGCQYILHENLNDKTTNLIGTGRVVSGIQINIEPTIKESVALQKVFNNVNAEQYAWEVHDSLKYLYPKGELIITLIHDTLQPIRENYCLSWKFDISSVKPFNQQTVYVNAYTGIVFKALTRIYSADGTGNTLFNGRQTFETKKRYGNFILLDETRGGGIHTKYKNGNFKDEDNNWADDDYDLAAISAHWAAQMTYDFYKNTFGRDSYDNNGSKIIVELNFHDYFDDARWNENGNYLILGTPSVRAHSQLVSLDVVGHELTHGVTLSSAELIYRFEPGALSESFSDIFGTMIEFYAEPNTGNYFLGEDYWIPDGMIRNMSNPKLKINEDDRQPDTYRGEYWNSGDGSYENDWGGVHTNSGVQNYWFYLLSEGGNGTNDNGYDYDVQGIGRDKAAEIAYLNLTSYLEESSGYQEACDNSILVAIELYGECSNEVIQTILAWEAVGIHVPNGLYNAIFDSESCFWLNYFHQLTEINIFALNNIVSNCNINNHPQSITFSAKNSIRLTSGFHVSAQSNFHAYISSCVMKEDLHFKQYNSQEPIDIKKEISNNNEIDNKQILVLSPNPFINSVSVSYKLTEASHCQIEIYDLYGQLQKVLVNQNQTAGTHQAYANLSGLPAGVYMCVLKTNNGTTTQKIIKTN